VKDIDTIRFTETHSGEDCLVIVRARCDAVALALSRASNGDIEVLLNSSQTSQLVDALLAARKIASE